ncbi:hypothetical protein [Streptomyces sp. SP18CS02]|uniref:hypothetical protein n=1 Tax=Streptomyces sp. SP18CS02 TaxID=3002531 RepID=UPI002E75F01A|nr:hypothetical protein [Streptomyces sp. SP18CS02]MEE1752780.1 hypothetical protein [Streptomyces sp. SP18CS02]
MDRGPPPGVPDPPAGTVLDLSGPGAAAYQPARLEERALTGRNERRSRSRLGG